MADVQEENINSSSIVPSSIVPSSIVPSIVFLLEELEVPYTIEKFNRRSIVIKDGDQVVAESGFIIDYLINKYGKDKHLKPTNEGDLFQFNYFLHYIEGTLMPILVMKFIFFNVQKMSTWLVRPIVNGICNKVDGSYLGPNIKLHLDFLESELQQRKWLAGEQFSGADIQASFAVEMLVKRSGVDMKDRPHLSEYITWMCERPAYKRAMEKVGKTSMSNV